MKFDKGIFIKSLLCGILAGILVFLLLWFAKGLTPAESFGEALGALFIAFVGVYTGLSLKKKE